MGSYLNLYTFYFFFILTCSFMEIYGRGGFGGGRGGGFGGGRGGGYGGGRGGGSSSRSSSGTSSRGSYKSSSSSISKPSSSSISKPSSSASSGSSVNRKISHGTWNRNPLYNNGMYRSSSGTGGSSYDYDRKSQDHYESKADNTEIRRQDTTFKPWIYRTTTPVPWKIAPPREIYKPVSIRNREPSHPFQREMDKVMEISKTMREASNIDLTELATGNSYGSRRHHFQKREACEGNQCFRVEKPKMLDDTRVENTSSSQVKVRNPEASLVKDSQA